VRPLSEDLALVHDARVVAQDGALRRGGVVELDEGDALVGGGVLVADDVARGDVPVDSEVGLDRLRGGLSGDTSDEHRRVHHRRLRWRHRGRHGPEQPANPTRIRTLHDQNFSF
jgi:hypothetical protein